MARFLTSKSGRKIHLCTVAVLLLCAFMSSGRGLAADQAAENDASREQTYDRLFQSMLRDPTNLDIMFRYAAVATKMENYEAAISALEPDSKVQLQ